MSTNDLRQLRVVPSRLYDPNEILAEYFTESEFESIRNLPLPERFAAAHAMNLPMPEIHITASEYQEFRRLYSWRSLGGEGYGQAFTEHLGLWQNRRLDPTMLPISRIHDSVLADLVIRRRYVR